MQIKRLLNQPLLILLLLLGMFSSSLLFASPLTQPSKDAAQVIGSPEYPANELYRVQFIAIDGRNIIGNREVIWLEPGRYTVTVRMIIRNPPGLVSREPADQYDTGYNQIEIVAEAGKTYHILGKYDAEREGAPYRTILYKVSDTQH